MLPFDETSPVDTTQAPASYFLGKPYINGSGIGLGHPIGSTGARIMTTLIYAMKSKRKSLGLATLCSGGVSMACAIEML